MPAERVDACLVDVAVCAGGAAGGEVVGDVRLLVRVEGLDLGAADFLVAAGGAAGGRGVLAWF